MSYGIIFSPDALDQLRDFPVRQQRLIVDTITEQLTYEPAAITRNRKPMRPNPIAPWELRIGELRVYYDIELEPELIVNIRAIGFKERNQVSISGEIVDL